jgi:hypothetical protein
MTADKFRSLALSVPGASESAHMRHPDFRLGGRVFATLRLPRRAARHGKADFAATKKLREDGTGSFSSVRRRLGSSRSYGCAARVSTRRLDSRSTRRSETQRA